MLRKPIKTKDLIKILKKFGFVGKRTKHGHTIFAHAKTGLVVTLPTNRTEVPSVYLRSIERQIGNFNIASDHEFERMLRS